MFAQEFEDWKEYYWTNGDKPWRSCKLQGKWWQVVNIIIYTHINTYTE